MDDEKIYKAAKLEYHIAIDSDKTKDFAFDCAIIEAIKQARASEREKTLDNASVLLESLNTNAAFIEALHRQWAESDVENFQLQMEAAGEIYNDMMAAKLREKKKKED